MGKLKVYIGCALSHAPKEYKLRIHSFKSELQKIPWIEVLEFVGALNEEPDPTREPLHIYTNDIHHCVGRAVAIIGELSMPSTGLGWELSTAVEKHCIRTMMCAKSGSNVSYVPLGAPLHEKNPHATFHWYEDSVLELLPYFLEELKKLHEK
ncbi:MAG: hypothetical protein JWL92_539 [Candidatus Nomurabacteria bacterium]|nr:hypothetical protein [Candidatus Nomurabacteria bacterium]